MSKHLIDSPEPDDNCSLCVEILQLLAASPSGELSRAELTDRIGVNRARIQRHSIMLAVAGKIITTQAGQRWSYKLAPQKPVLPKTPLLTVPPEISVRFVDQDGKLLETQHGSNGYTVRLGDTTASVWLVPGEHSVPVQALTAVPERRKVAEELAEIIKLLQGTEVHWSMVPPEIIEGAQTGLSTALHAIHEQITNLALSFAHHAENHARWHSAGMDLLGQLMENLPTDARLDGLRAKLSAVTTDAALARAFIADNMPSRGWTLPLDRQGAARGKGGALQFTPDETTQSISVTLPGRSG